MTDVITRNKQKESGKQSRTSLSDINELLDFANVITGKISDLEQKKRKRSMQLNLFIIGAFLFVLSGYILLKALNMGGIDTFLIFIAASSILLIAYLVMITSEKIDIEIAVEAQLLGELIDMINSLVESLPKTEAVVPVALVKMKLRRLSFSAHSSKGVNSSNPTSANQSKVEVRNS